MKKTPPEEYFKTFRGDEFNSYDERGIPTSKLVKSKEGQDEIKEFSKEQKKEFEKEFNKQKKTYEDYLKKLKPAEEAKES
jgi:hypothetical protein